MFSMAKKFIGHVMPGVIRPIHILWNQVIGFFFIVLALLPIHGIFRDWGKAGHRPPAGAMKYPSPCCMAGFGIHSFLTGAQNL